MKTTLKLKHGFYVDGKKLKKVNADPDAMSGNLYVQAMAEAAKAKGFNPNTNIEETDYIAHLYLGIAAIIAENPTFDFLEVMNGLKGYDIKIVSAVGRDFFNASGDAEDANSEEPTEIIPENSTVA